MRSYVRLPQVMSSGHGKKILQAPDGRGKSTTDFQLPFEHYKFLMMFLRVLGVVPLTLDRNTGVMRFKLFSYATAYTLLLILLSSGLVVFVLISQLQVLAKYDLTFDEQFNHYGIIITHGFHLLPFWAFVESRQLCKLAHLWSDFSDHYIKATGRPLVISLRMEQYVMAVMLVLATALYLTAEEVLLRERFGLYEESSSIAFHIAFKVVSVTYVWMNMALCGAWYVITSSIRKAATALLQQLKEFPRGAHLEDIHSLWLQLRGITEDTGRSFSLTVSYYLVFMFVLVMGASYALFIFPVGKLAALGLAVSAYTGFGVMGECAHQALSAVTSDFLKTLFDMMTSERLLAVRKDIGKFARSIAFHTPHISLSGFVKLDRAFNVSMLGSVVTYMVIAIQFRTTPNTTRTYSGTNLQSPQG